MTRRLVFTGGGTGGHIYPALALIEPLLAEPTTEILYIGNANSLEAQLVQQLIEEVLPKNPQTLSFKCIAFSGMPRQKSLQGLWAWLKWFMHLFMALIQAQQHLKAFQPQIVVGTGGYVSAPVLMAAKALGIPYLIHEPDAEPGLVNRFMSRWAACVTAGFAASQPKLQARRFIHTGNPLRGQLGHVSKTEALQKLGVSWKPTDRVLVVTGGSQGSKTLNHAVVRALPVLIDELGLKVVHQTGNKLFEDTMHELSVQQGAAPYREHLSYWVRPYFNDMASVLATADVALCRAGALTLSEMTLCGIPTILVPYPYAAADHQRKNAVAFEQAGASRMILDAACTSEGFLTVLKQVLLPETYQSMKTASQALAKPDATASILALIRSSFKA